MTVQRSVSFEDEEVINRHHPNSHSEHSSPESTDKDTHLVPNVRTPNAGEIRITCPDNQTGDGDVQRKSCRVIRRQHVMTREYSITCATTNNRLRVLLRTIDYVCYSEQSITCYSKQSITCATTNNRLRVLRRTIDYVGYDEHSITCVTANNRLHVLRRTIDNMCYGEQSITCVTANNRL